MKKYLSNKLPSILLLTFAILLSVSGISQIELELQDTQVTEGSDGAAEKDWPTNFWIGFTLEDPEGVFWYAYDPPYTGEPESCPGTFLFNSNETHDGLYKERQTECTFTLYRNNIQIFEDTWEGTLSYQQTYMNFVIHDVPKEVFTNGTYKWHCFIKQHRLIVGWKTLVDDDSNPMYIDLFDDFVDINYQLDNSKSYEKFALQELTLSPGFEYNPNTGKSFLGYIKICGSKSQSIVKNFEIGTENLKSSNVNDSNTEISNIDIEENIDEVTIYPNPSIDGKFYIKSKIKVYDLNIYSSTGRLVFSEAGLKNPNISIDLTEETPGLYFIKIINGSNTINKKLIITN